MRRILGNTDTLINEKGEERREEQKSIGEENMRKDENKKPKNGRKKKL